MSKQLLVRKNLQSVRRQRSGRVRAKIHGTTERPRLAVFRSLKHLSVQLIDDTRGATVLSVSDREVAGKKHSGLEVAAAIGALVAERAKAKGITAIVFDRRQYRYHGRVKGVAEAAREGGLTF